ncbi:uncharacterized protein LOC126774164 isoform X1 [Nymphalis io]|uniref:uncharacterized protein LOC126774164 isoform X1 n=1 Tax=Inachis io TaxID=171585 RepID=UPI0021673CFB|nr:uncharacterized protein LOC126774164 isoform X1 [Nymphalis io]
MKIRKKNMKQENEITKSKQLLQKATKETPYSFLPHKRKQENKPIVASTISMSEMFHDLYGSFDCVKTFISRSTLPDSDNTTCQNLPLKIEDEIIIIDDDDDEPEIPLKKSKPDNTFSYTSHLPSSKNNENKLNYEDTNNYELSIYKEKERLHTKTVKYDPYDFYPIPSTSTNTETILKNEQKFQEYLSQEVNNSHKIIEENCQPLITDDTTTQELNNKIKSQYDMDAQKLNCKKESNNTDINKSNINCPIMTDIIDPIDFIDLSIIDVDKVIGENNLILNKIRNREKNRIGKLIEVIKTDSEEIIPVHSELTIIDVDKAIDENNLILNKIRNGKKNRIGKFIEVIKTDSEEIIPVLNDSSNIQDTVSTICLTTQIDLSGVPASPARTHEDPYSVQSIERSKNVPYKSSQKLSYEKPNVRSRQVEPSVPNMLNQITNPSVLPINLPVVRTTNPISQSYSSQLDNSNENLIINYNAIITCNCIQQTQHKGLSQISNIERKHSDQNTQQNINSTEDKTNIISARCPICMETLAEKVIASTLCGHIFCMPCIKEALKYPPKKCPTCRQKIFGLGYHQIFLF